MKFHKLLLSLLAGAALFTGCQLEEPVSDSTLAVKVNPSMLSFDGKTAGEAEIEVTAQANWTAAIPADADWVTITPASGGVGTAKVKVTVLAGGENDRKAEISFKAGTDTQLLTVEQSGGLKYGTQDNPYTASKAYDWVAGKPADTNTEEVYIKGIICKIDAPYMADDYGNASFYISDDGKDEGKVFQCYRCLYITPVGEKAGVKYSNPADPNISVGDEVLIYGQCVNYKGNTPETAQNKAWLIELKAGTNPVLTVASPAVEILADATEAKFAVEAKNIAKWSVAAKETYDWVTDFTKEGTTSGDITVTVAPNTSADPRVAKFAVSADGVDAIELTLTQKGASVASTIAEITAQITSADKNNPSAYSANLTGAVVSYVNGGNAYIEDESGAILLYLSNHGLEPGKKISGVVKGTGYLYNGLPEITAIGSEAVIADGGTIPQTEMTIADLLANYAPNYSRRILLKGVTVKDAIADGDRNGVVTQNGAEINVYAGLNNKGLVLTEGATGDFICFPTVYINKNTGEVTNQLSFWDNEHFTASGEAAAPTIKDFAKEYVKILDVWQSTTGTIDMLKGEAYEGGEWNVANAHYVPSATKITIGGKEYTTGDLFETALRSYLLIRGYNGLDAVNYGKDKIAALEGGAVAMSATEVPETHGYYFGESPFNETPGNGGHLVLGTKDENEHCKVKTDILDNWAMRSLNFQKGQPITNLCGYANNQLAGYYGCFCSQRALITYAFFFKYLLDNNLDKADAIPAETIFRSELFGDENAAPAPATVEIKTADEFVAWAANATSDATLEADITLPEGFTPVASFAGVFDGKGHTITYNYSYAGEDKVADKPEVADHGIFKVLSGEVRNLKAAGSIAFAAAAGAGTFHVGGIVGKTDGDKAVIENCENAVNILATTKVTHHIGGIAGYTAAGTKVSGCTNKGKIEMIIPEKAAANASQLGGIIGHIEGKAVVENCTNGKDGQVTYEGNGTPRTGGICGYINNATEVTFRGCVNNAPIVFNSNYSGTSWSYVGGITGYYGTPVDGAQVLYENCSNSGKIDLNITEDKSKMRAAGIASHGGKTSTADATFTWTLKNCVNTGEVVSTSTTANNYLGGVIGYCEVSAKVVCDGCTNDARIATAGNGTVGAILGRNCSVASTFTNFKIGTKTSLEYGAEGGFVGLACGWNPALTTAITGKVLGGSVTKVGAKTDLTAANFAEYVVPNALGEGGSVTGVTFGE